MPSTRPAQIAFVVDDEPQVRTFVARCVKQLGFEPREYSRVADVEMALTRVKPDLILLDLSLGSTDAVEVMRSLAAARFSGSLILMSGHDARTLDEVQKIGRRQGLSMLDHLRKPFRLDDLKARLSGLRPPGEPPARAERVDLQTGLQNRWLELWYQPKVDLRRRRICGAEALVRMRLPSGELLPPGAFLPPAGDPLFRPLTDFVVRRALADWPTIAAARGDIRLSVNVPASILQTPDFVANFRRHLPSGIAFPGLIVEITETETLHDPDLARETAVQLRLYDLHVSVDDFGTGYSTLSRLDELPFAELKLDRGYVNGCASDSGKRETCRSVVELAHRFGISTVAEGVETAEDLAVLDELGCDIAQGYYFAKPSEIDAFVDRLVAGPL
ncbi:MAG: EAL domain-containing response regulator [Rhodospirillales bacterium]|nr:EAL domain-containing response regulator [Rhodospirillales bacterium]